MLVAEGWRVFSSDIRCMQRCGKQGCIRGELTIFIPLAEIKEGARMKVFRWCCGELGREL